MCQGYSVSTSPVIMGIRFSRHRKSDKSLVVSITPLASSPSPEPREEGETGETQPPCEFEPKEHRRVALVKSISRSSLLSSSSSSSFPAREKRRVSFDLVAEMAYAFPEQPLSPVLVELEETVAESEEEIVNICDGSSTSSEENNEEIGPGAGEVGVVRDGCGNVAGCSFPMFWVGVADTWSIFLFTTGS